MLYSSNLNNFGSSSSERNNFGVDTSQEDCVPQQFFKNFENDLTAPPTQSFPFLTNINASASIKNTSTTNLNQNNKYYFNQTEKEEKFCSDNGNCWWLLPPPNSPYNSPSDFISSPEKNISSPDSNISNNSSCKVFGGNQQNSFELDKNNEIPLEDWELTRLTVRELNQKLAGQDRSIVSALKQKRRTLKNRGYALNCRARRLKNQQQLEEENARLKIIINQQANLLAEYERKLGRETQQLQFVERKNSISEDLTLEYQQQQPKQHNYQHNTIFSNQQQPQALFKNPQCSSQVLGHSSFLSPLDSEQHNSIPIEFHQQMSSSSSNVYNSNLDLGQNLWNSFE
uniref:Basic leucine zipper domain-containing protein n=1 Tax=Meloidogyne enterolobii TaxID=390850 RepID=A0A6V7UGX1_MELEN|nr:unnamed protein product [Meloidogyne enterolobii]